MSTSSEGGSARHYAALDGLRGFAAISVLVYHLGRWLHTPTVATNSWLAVDLFFCLSGFVLPLAYQRQFDYMSNLAFLRRRLRRLMPLIILALVISAGYVVIRNRGTEAGISYPDVARAFLLGLCNLPYFGAPHSVGGPLLFPLNGPQYTPFLELIVNLVWWATRGVNQVWLSLAIALLCFPTLLLTGLGGDVAETFWSGFPRVGASFFAGVFVFHLAHRLPVWRGWTVSFWLLFAVMAALFYAPVPAPRAIQILWVAILSPLLLLAGSKACLPSRIITLSMFSGALSYPVYCLHYPLFEWINGVYRARFGPQDIWIEGPLVMLLVLAVSFAVVKYYEVPLRSGLRARRQ
jgi:peptidoglycan/LPS O-acetylase OafA/YrhL